MMCGNCSRDAFNDMMLCLLVGTPKVTINLGKELNINIDFSTRFKLFIHAYVCPNQFVGGMILTIISCAGMSA